MSNFAPRPDIDIARETVLRPIEAVAARLGLGPEQIYRYGPHKAKLAPDVVAAAQAGPRGKLILVTAINPTAAGEGKTTTTIGLGDALARQGKRVAVALREPSLGPCFGAKGGATGGGLAQVAPMDEINLHFTGDFHAISAAHNLLAALIDNHVYWGNALDLDLRRLTWRRVVDLNDRALREVVVGLGAGANGAARETGFDITVASEVMAIFCLARSQEDLQRRLGQIVIGETRARELVRAVAIEAAGAMTALLKDAFQPNLVQTLEGTPALIHGGPFANIAHGCNSVVATDTALGLADYVVTEAGFGADLGAEKFLDIKCRKAGFSPAASVVVATVRALKLHGGVAKQDLGIEDRAAVRRGAANLVRHIENLRKFGIPVLVAVNNFTGDTAAEHAEIEAAATSAGARAFRCTHWAEGGGGAAELASAVIETAEADAGGFKTLYPDSLPLADKIATIAREIYRADGVAIAPAAAKRLAQFEAQGFGHFPVCMAKTQYSFSADPDLKGAPTGFTVPVREVRLAAGAEFIVALCGDVMTMPGLPRIPAANAISVDREGLIHGLF
ncbi:MAG TPA: formate--tetrahydrofolate ligase [Stellaceae bacterium]|nr:formate--tetrahydrofolate ligase [Stellaceae bacterium]